MIAVDDATPTLGAAPACRVLGLSRASLYRGRRPAAVARPRPAPPRALDPIERQSVLDLLHTRFIDQAPAQVHAALLDEGTYLCSPRTMYRVLDAADEIKERRDQVRRPHYAAPELLATRPNEVWSWDITKLLGPAKWTYFYLYVILDIFSRYVVGWMLAPHESAALAERLIAETCAKHGIQPGQLTLHADRGTSMKSKPVALLLADLGVTKTHSRPHVSNDNPFSEAQFKTLKYWPQFPERFGSLEDGRAFGQRFFPWYNQEHRHSGLGFLTPAVVHFGQAGTVRAQRQQVLATAYTAHPERFVNGRPHAEDLPTAVWINPPPKNAIAQEAPDRMKRLATHSTWWHKSHRGYAVMCRTEGRPAMDHIGMDAGMVNSHICELREDGEVVERQIRTDRKRLLEVFGTRPKARILMEASTESEWIACCLEELGHDVIVADPNFAPMYAHRSRRIKTDRRDARALAEACRLGAYRPAHRTSPTQRDVRALLGIRELLVRTRTRWIVHIRALLRRDGLRLAPGRAENFVPRVNELPLSPLLAAQIAPVLELLAPLNTQIAELDTTVAIRARDDERTRRLMSVPGVGPVTSLAFVATVDRVTRFRNAHQLESYLGLVPREWSSSEMQRKGSITKAGNTRMRWLLVEAAWCVMRRKKKPETTRLRDWADGIALRRGSHVAAVALARRLAGILYAMWRDQTEYDPNQLGRGGRVRQAA